MPKFRFSVRPEYTYFDEEAGGIRPRSEVFDEGLFEWRKVGDDLVEIVCKETGRSIAKCEIVGSEAKSDLLESMGY